MAGSLLDEGVFGPQEQRGLAPPVVEEPAPRHHEVVGTGPAERVEMRRDVPVESLGGILESRHSPGVVVPQQSGRGVMASRLRTKSHGSQSTNASLGFRGFIADW